MIPISSILKRHLSDKCTHHNYSATYDRLLAPLQESAKCVLEIGIENGCSLRAFREFFVNADIWGIEKEEHLIFQGERITTMRCDTTERDRFIEVCSKLPTMDFICDDGSHTITEQIWTVAVLWPRLKPGGIFIVEDIYRPEYLPLFQCFNAEILDLRVPGGCQDDLIAVMRKPERNLSH